MQDSVIHADTNLLNALGAVTIDFSMLDASLQLAISLMMMPGAAQIEESVDAALRNMIVTSEMSFRQRIYAFASLYRHRWPASLTDDFENLCKKLHASEDRRNQLVHSSYVADPNTGASLRRKATAKTKLGFRWHVETTDATEIREFAESLRSMADAVVQTVLRRLIPSGSIRELPTG